jgi:hypothetical protein
MLNSPGENALTRMVDSLNSAAKYRTPQFNLALSAGKLSVISDERNGASFAIAGCWCVRPQRELLKQTIFKTHAFSILVFAKTLNYEHSVKTGVKTFLIRGVQCKTKNLCAPGKWWWISFRTA